MVALDVGTAVAIAVQLVVPAVADLAVVTHIGVVVEMFVRHYCDVVAVVVDEKQLVELHAELPGLELVGQPASNPARGVAVVHQS